jgi:LysM repeat protein
MPQQRLPIPWSVLDLLSLAAATCNVSALQMGPINVHSRIGEPLSASVGLWLNLKDKSEVLRFKISPDLSYIGNTRLTDIVNRMDARLERSSNGNTYVQITTDGNVAEPIVAFRLKVHVGDSAVMRNFSLALAPASRVASVRNSRTQTTPKATALRTQPTRTASPISGSDYTVSSGDTLWGIARRVNRSNREPMAELVDNIFATNPQAFVGGDRNKLKVGAHLTLEAAISENIAPRNVALKSIESDAASAPQPAAVNSVVVPAPIEQTSPVVVPKVSVDWRLRKPEVAAELAALKNRYASLMARYGDQVAAAQTPKQPALSTPQLVTTDLNFQEPVKSPSVQVAAQPTIKKIQSEPPIEGSTESTSPAAQNVTSGDTDMAADSSALYCFLSSGTVLIVLAVILGIAAIVLIGYQARKELQMQGLRRAEFKFKRQELGRREEVARKAKARVEMQSEVKRLLAENDRLATNDAAKQDESLEQEINITSQSPQNKDADIDLNIAHGRYDEAENSLLQVIAAAPRNYSAKLRLIAVFYMTERVTEFCTLADELQSGHRADMSDEEWRRIVRMGKIIAPDEVRFSGPRAIANPPNSA